MNEKYIHYKWFLRGLALSLSAAAVISAWTFTSIQALAQEFIRRSWTDTSVTLEQFENVIGILRENAGQDTGGQNTIMFDTAVYPEEGTDGFQLCYNIRSLFLGQDGFGICYNQEGLPQMTAEIVENSDQGMGIRFHAVGEEMGVPVIFAGWLPGSDPAEYLRQHDEAMAVLQQAAANAPADDAEAYRYFYEWLCGRVTFDDTYSIGRHSAYSAVVEGSSVCEGYARAFEALCWLTGRYCRCVTVQVDGSYGTHERNLVFLDGEPKWVDVTWGDQPDGINYEYLLYDVDSMWRQQLGL